MNVTVHFANGKDLKQWTKRNHKNRCRSPMDGLFYGYISGAIDGLIAANRDIYFRIPEAISVEELGDIVEAYVANHDIDETESAAAIIIYVLQEKWPLVSNN